MTPLFILIIVAIFLVAATPVFVIGKRSGLRNPWAAFILLLGVWIVLFEAIGRSGWLSLLVFIPTAGPLIALLWTGVELPAQHGRSRWWTLPLIVPFVNLLAYWFYAFTVPRDEPSFT
jgi:hypothetical protein